MKTLKEKIIEWYVILNTTENNGLDAGIVRDEMFDWINIEEPKKEEKKKENKPVRICRCGSNLNFQGSSEEVIQCNNCKRTHPKDAPQGVKDE